MAWQQTCVSARPQLGRRSVAFQDLSDFGERLGDARLSKLQLRAFVEADATVQLNTFHLVGRCTEAHQLPGANYRLKHAPRATQFRPFNGLFRRDVLVETQHIMGVVLLFNLRQPSVVRPVSGLDERFARLAQLVDVHSLSKGL